MEAILDQTTTVTEQFLLNFDILLWILNKAICEKSFSKMPVDTSKFVNLKGDKKNILYLVRYSMASFTKD